MKEQKHQGQTKMPYIDIRSDTVTQPTFKMRQQILNAEMGDHTYNQDVNVTKLEKLAAEIMGKEAASFVPSGCFGNQCSILTAGCPGGEIILSQRCHMLEYQQGGIGAISRMLTRTVQTDNNMFMQVVGVKRMIRKLRDTQTPPTLIFSIQNPTSTGKVYPVDQFNQILSLAQNEKLHIHMDGARIFNACEVLKIKPSQLVKKCSSVMFCLSKGLCCPMGSIVVGSNQFIKKFNINRKMMGGVTRKPGIFASMGIIALNQMIPHIAKDHQIAKKLAVQLSSLSWIQLMGSPQTNMIFYKFKDDKINNTQSLQKYLLQKRRIKSLINQKVNAPNRIVVHHYIREEQVNQILEGFQSFYKQKIEQKQE